MEKAKYNKDVEKLKIACSNKNHAVSIFEKWDDTKGYGLFSAALEKNDRCIEEAALDLIVHGVLALKEIGMDKKQAEKIISDIYKEK